jgi:hypothetical protein
MNEPVVEGVVYKCKRSLTRESDADQSRCIKTYTAYKHAFG